MKIPLSKRRIPKSTTDQRSRGGKKANRTKWYKPVQPPILNWSTNENH